MPYRYHFKCFFQVPVICVNAVDDNRCPTDPPNGFLYVVENVHTSQDTKIQHDIVSSITVSLCVCVLNLSIVLCSTDPPINT